MPRSIQDQDITQMIEWLDHVELGGNLRPNIQNMLRELLVLRDRQFHIEWSEDPTKGLFGYREVTVTCTFMTATASLAVSAIIFPLQQGHQQSIEANLKWHCLKQLAGWNENPKQIPSGNDNQKGNG